jgi:membrane associated rhomboid family serine protease
MRARYPDVSGMHYSFGPGGITPAVKAIIIANVAVFVVMFFAPGSAGGFPGVNPLELLLGVSPGDLFERFFIWQPFTYMFVHAGLGHIFFNMLLLWFIGVDLERMWGTVFFTKFYVACGLGAAATQVVLGILPFGFADAFYDVHTVGASGAIYGLLLAFALYFPTRPFLVFLIFPVQARVFVLIMGGIALLLSLGGAGGVAHTAHLGGMATAWFYLRGKRMNLASEIQYRYLKWKINRMRRKFDVYSGGRRDDIDRRVH